MESSNVPQDVSRRHVFVTGAGFTRAVVPCAHLLVNDFNNDSLEDTVRGLPNASRLLNRERSKHPEGHIDIERLMTRLDALMPYDYADDAGNAANEYAFLLTELRRAFLGRLHKARQGDIKREELDRFAKFCADNGCSCITFNYDDFLDEALNRTDSWGPYWGYGFFSGRPATASAVCPLAKRTHACCYSSSTARSIGDRNWDTRTRWRSTQSLITTAGPTVT